jgi:hypothetical protein
MSRPRSYRPSPALAVACLALLFVLVGTSGAAVSQAPPKNSVGTNQLKNNAVTAAKIKNSAVTAAKIGTNAVTAAKIAANAVSSPKVADGSLQAGDLAAGVLPPSSAAGRFVNGPVNVSTTPGTVASLAISDAGSYVIWAKAYFTTPLLAGVVSCRLEAGANFDESQSYVANEQPATMSSIVLNTFAAAGTVNFACSATTPKQANFVKIVAVRVANLTNTG